MKLLTPTFTLLIFIHLFFYSTNLYAQPGRFSSRSAGFIENKGQIIDQLGRKNSSVKYLLTLPGGLNVQLRKGGYSYDTYRHTDSAGAVGDGRYFFERVDVEFIGANPSPRLLAQEKLPFQYTYCTAGNDNLRVGIYGRVVYKDLYPSVDLVFENSGRGDSTGGIEYYFVVRPGGDANAIRWRYKGGKKNGLTDSAITVELEKGHLKEHIPLSYLEKSREKANVRVCYRQTGPDVYGFHVPSYDRRQTLTIDPTPDLIWGTYYGNNYEIFNGIARQSNGNLVVAGYAMGARLATSGAYMTNMAGFTNVLIASFTPSGSLAWATYYGGEAFDRGYCIAVDGSDNIFVGGTVSSTTGIATPGAYMTTRPNMGVNNAFLAKFNPNGMRIWGTYYGSYGFDDNISSLAVDKNNNVIVGGSSFNALSNSHRGFFAQFGPGGPINWNVLFGSKSEYIGGVAVDPNNNIIVGGSTITPGLATTGAYQTTLGGQQNCAVVGKYSNSGSLIWMTYLGTGAQTSSGVGGVRTDAQGNIYVCGTATATGNIATPGAVQPALGKDFDGYAAKFSNTGSLLWGTYLGSAGYDLVGGIAEDGSGGVFVTGSFSGPSVAVTPNAYQPGLNGASLSAFLTKLDAGTGALVWGTYYGYPNSTYSKGVVADGAGNVYIAGQTEATNNIATCGAVQSSKNGTDAFVAKFGKGDPATTPDVAITADKTGTICGGTAVNFNATYQNGGANPSFTWLVNGKVVHTGAAQVTLSPADGDVISCMMDIHSTCGVSQFNSNQLSFSVNDGLSPTVAIQTAATTVCAGVATRFTATGSNTGDRPVYQWYINTIPRGSNSTELLTDQLADGDVVSCQVTKQDICSMTPTATSNPIVVTVRKSPLNNVHVDVSGGPACDGSPITFTATADGGNLSYQWMVNGNKAGSDVSVFSSSSLHDGDEVSCVATVKDDLCTFLPVASNSNTARVYPVPTLSIMGDTMLTRGQPGQLYVNVGNIPSGLTYTWTPGATLNDPFISNPVALPTATTTYTVNVTSDGGCSSKGSITVHLLTKLVPPSAFTPNGDGTNDVFRIQYESDISAVHFYVYNRWGQLVFVDEGTHRGWDGQFAGSPQPAGSYVWVFQYKDKDGKVQVIKGVVELIR